MSGVIYQITCNATGLKYIGQATCLKYKNGKPYNYGALGRWSDHVSSSKSRNTPLCNAIKKYGKEQFTIEILEEGELESLDEREAYWISTNNTIYPSGYNIAKHARNRHRDSSNLHLYYKDKVANAVISPIKQDGEFKLAYVYLNLNDGTQERLAFGQKAGSTYEDTLNEVNIFIENLKCSYSTSTAHSDILSEKYATKLAEFNDKEITSVRITSASNLIAVYVGTSEMKFNKDHKRICFGGKTISKDEAYEIAKQFVAELHVSDEIITDSIQCRQQATA
jgi:group I intron endonuclease